MGKLLSRKRLTIGAGAIIVLILAAAFWPSASEVDMGKASIGPMIVTIDEEAKTRVRDAYIVSAPVSGRLLRVEVEPGDEVTASVSVVARMLPANPEILNVRAEEQAEAAIRSAKAALDFARAQSRAATADFDLAQTELERTRQLFASQIVAQARLDRDERNSRAAGAAVETSKAAVAMREADLENAEALLLSFSDSQKLAMSTNPHPREAIPLNAPISGKILQVMQESETTLVAGAPILEIGDISNDLEVFAELLSTDAVQIAPGNRVLIEKWGGGEELYGVVERVEPWGFTKFSALGVEEQRVRTIIQFADDTPEPEVLGHGYRVEARIIIWEDDDALIIPSSALFRENEQWSVFQVKSGKARLTRVEVSQNNGIEAAIASGLENGATIIIYPGSDITDGERVKRRTMTPS